MTSINLVSEVSIFPPLALKKSIGNNHGYRYILVMECQVTVYVYANTVDFLREKVRSSRNVACFSSLKRFVQVWHSF